MTTTTVINLKHENPPTDGRPYQYIGRSNTPYHYGNPFHIGVDGTRPEVVNKFRLWMAGIAYTHVEPKRRKWILKHVEGLKGKVLGCYCKPQSCHGDVLKSVADMK